MFTTNFRQTNTKTASLKIYFRYTFNNMLLLLSNKLIYYRCERTQSDKFFVFKMILFFLVKLYFAESGLSSKSHQSPEGWRESQIPQHNLSSS